MKKSKWDTDFEEERLQDNNISIGEEKVIKDGVKGLKEITYKVIYKNGKKVKKQEITQSVIRQPVNKVIAYNNVVSKHDLNNYKKVNNRDIRLLSCFINLKL